MKFFNRGWLFPLVIMACGLVWSSCSSGLARSERGGRSDLLVDGPEPAELEERLLGYLVDITNLLTAGHDDPQSKVVAIGRYLGQNRDDIIQVAVDVRGRIDAMTPAERVYYQELFAEYYLDATRGWLEALSEFRQQHPEHAQLIDGLMLRFD